ncbi:MAG: TlpA family protein disulfide reductase [Gammaproteobacteria bacterium]|nr:TlpA family protein disulfide reductase [Gammaproteobacteria bacterium]
MAATPVPGIAQNWPLPALQLAALDGGTQPLVPPGKVTLINFWATWCVPCLQEIPDLVRLQQQGGHVHIVGVALDSGSAMSIRAFAQKHGMTYSLLMADGKSFDPRFGLFGLPTTLIVDRQGIVRRRLLGPQTLAQFQAALGAANEIVGR